MKNSFENLRKRLHKSIEENRFYSEKIRKLSEQFDKLINSYYKNERQYYEENFMHIKYNETLNHLRKISREFGKFPTIEEWNKYAKEQDLLCSESLKYISGINWHALRNRTLSEK